jgi:hypothetical protein
MSIRRKPRLLARALALGAALVWGVSESLALWRSRLASE